MKTLTLTLLLMVLPATGAQGQALASPALCLICRAEPVGPAPGGPDLRSAQPLPAAPSPVENGSLAGAIAGGIIGGVVGGVVLGYAGYHLTGGGRICGDDSCGLLGGALGLVFGEMIGAGAGVHIGNGRHGSLGADIGVSLSAGLLGGGLVSQFSDDAALPGALLLQLGLTVAVERGFAGLRYR